MPRPNAKRQPSPADQGEPAERRGAAARWWMPLVIIAATLAAFWNSQHGAFVFDDLSNIVMNEKIRDIGSIPSMLTSERRPLVTISLALNYAISAYQVTSYHWFNIAVHACAALSLFGVLRRAWPLCTEGRDGSMPALLIATLWAVHPLQTASVTYVIQRSESMMGLFLLLTFYCFLRSLSGRRWIWAILAILACAAGMGSKAVMITAPPVILLFDLCMVERSPLRILARRWWFYAGLAATYLVIVGTGVAGAVLSTSETNAGVGFSMKAVTPLTYAMTQPGVLLHYLRLSLWPNPLCLDYAWPFANSIADAIVPATILAAIAAALIWGLPRRPRLGIFLLGSIMLVLGPTSSIIPIRDAAFEHRMYIPLAAVITAAVILLGQAMRSLRLPAFFGPVTGALIIVVAGFATTQRNRVYASEVTMWANVVAQRPENTRALTNYGNALKVANRRDDAIAMYRRAVQLDPGDWKTLANLARSLEGRGDFDEAIRVYETSLENDGHWRVRQNLGNALVKSGRIEDAIGEYEQVLEIKPRHHDVLISLGQAYYSATRIDDALQSFELAATYAPDSADAHFYRGQVLGQLGRVTEAATSFRRVLEINPGHADAQRYVERYDTPDR